MSKSAAFAQGIFLGGVFLLLPVTMKFVSLEKENRILQDQLELIKTIKCEGVLEAPKVGE